MLIVLYVILYFILGVILLVLIEKGNPSSVDDGYIFYVIFWPFWLFIALLFYANEGLKWLVKKVNNG